VFNRIRQWFRVAAVHGSLRRLAAQAAGTDIQRLAYAATTFTFYEKELIEQREKLEREQQGTFNMIWAAAMIWCVGKGLSSGMGKEEREDILRSVYENIARKPWFQQETFLRLSDEMDTWMPISLTSTDEVPLLPVIEIFSAGRAAGFDLIAKVTQDIRFGFYATSAVTRTIGMGQSLSQGPVKVEA
jgi:hypothetical protein